jgi:hypothetical protein
MHSRLSKIGLYLILAAVGLVMALVCAELATTVYYFVREGKYVSPKARLAAEKNIYVEAAQAEAAAKRCNYGDSLLVHPYLAFVQTGLGPCGASYANSKGLIGKEFPDKPPRPRTGIVLITGGSVAAQFVWDNRKQESPLERILNAEFVGDQFDRFIVLNGGHGAWKQPNQYILFGLHADVLAGVITLDGFNEHYMIGSTFRFELPASNFFQVIERQDARVTTAPLTMAALKLEADLYRLASRNAIFQVSNLAYLVVDVIRGKLRRYASRTRKISTASEEEWVKASYAKMFALNDELSHKERELWALRQYEKYIRLIHAGAQAFGIKNLFLIQPIPGWGKPLTEEEKALVQKTDSKLYKRMADHISGLRERERIPAYSLLDIFNNEERQIYKDAIHVNELGNEIIARRVADLIEKIWGWPRKRSGASTQSRSTN